MSGGNFAQSAFVSFDLPRLTPRRIIIAAAVVVLGLGLAAGIAALIVRSAPHGIVEAAAEHPALPLLPDAAPDAPAPATPSPAQRPTPPAPVSLAEDEPPQHVASPQPKPVVSPPLKDAPIPPPRPAELARPAEFALPGLSPSGPFEQGTAVYVLTAHTVYMPDGTRLEAHSGLGDLLDDPRHVDEKDRGATPPHLYDLTMREGLFHGVQALRLNPIGGENSIFGRAGLLAHPYMLGPTGDSNGCVSFKDYDAFLQAFQNGKVKRLAVVANLSWQVSTLSKP
jgi:hypothetical protein